MKTRNSGFTLIELLVVIAIIGILSSVVLAALGTARGKARDAKDISDLKQVQLSLEFFADDNNGNYPSALSELETGGYMSPIPSGFSFASDGSTEYHLGVALERPEGMPGNDLDCDSSSASGCFGKALTGGFAGEAPAGTGDLIYDQRN